MTFYRQREAKNRMRKKTDSEAVSEDAANTLIEIASKTFGDLICRFDGKKRTCFLYLLPVYNYPLVALERKFKFAVKPFYLVSVNP